MKTIQLSDLTSGGEIRNLSGHDKGAFARGQYELDALDRSGERVVVVVPPDLYALAPSFFQGMFAESVRAAGSRNEFLARYSFDAKEYVLQQIENGIRQSLMKRGSLLAG